MINYNFNLVENNLSNEINKIISNKDNKNNFQQCCLIKKLYHVKGKVSVYEVDKKGGFNILFTADSDSNGPSCNNKDNLCLGPSFPCLEKEYNKKILIESKNILFILIRYYFRKQSGLEIFTCNPYKSYYFNFKEIIDAENINNKINKKSKTKNKLIDACNKNQNFKFIQENGIFLYYNIYHKYRIFPLILGDKIDLYNMTYFYNNYDLLTIINLLSNRSFKDIYQYPVFPMLYEPFYEINNLKDNNKNNIIERDLSNHIGLQSVNENAIKRKQKILDTEKNRFDFSSPLFKVFFSNLNIISNFLMRLIPFSFIAVEYNLYMFEYRKEELFNSD